MALVLALALSGCVQMADFDPGDPVAACPVVASSDWAAWVNLMPGPDMAAAMVIVTGSVTLPRGGLPVGLQAGALSSGRTPTRELRLMALPPPPGARPSGPPQTRVRFEMPAQRFQSGGPSPWGAVRITCGGRELARLVITEAH